MGELLPALKQTLILPAEDGALASKLLEEIIRDKVMAVFVVIGDDLEDVVRRADTRAEAYPGIRHVVWIRRPSTPELKARVDDFRAGSEAVVAVVLSFADRVVSRFQRTDVIDNLAIEAAFFKAMSMV